MGCNLSKEEPARPRETDQTAEVFKEAEEDCSFKKGTKEDTSLNCIPELVNHFYIKNYEFKKKLEKSIYKAKTTSKKALKNFLGNQMRFSKKRFKPAVDYKQDLECPICCVVFNQLDEKPVLLQCGHILCQSCIKKDFDSFGRVRCPYDRELTSDNIDDLKIIYSLISSFENQLVCETHEQPFVSFCIEDKKLLCAKCMHHHHSHPKKVLLEEEMKNQLIEWKLDLEHYKLNLNSASEDLKQNLEKANKEEKLMKNSLKEHINTLEHTKNLIVHALEEALNSHLEQLEEHFENKNPASETIQSMLEVLEQEKNKLDMFLDNFEQVPFSEKLEVLGEGKLQVPKFEVPSLEGYKEFQQTMSAAPSPTFAILAEALNKMSNKT